jgi:ParB family chromosome partitioning protein
MNNEVQMLPIETIVESKTNPRKHFDEKKLKELAASIKADGNITPILVRPVNGHYELVAGARRLRAAKLGEVPTLRALIQDLSDEKAFEIQVLENLQREDVHPLDEGEGYAQLQKKNGYDIDTIAAKVSKTASYVYQRLKLAELIEPAKKAFFADRMTPSHAILIARLTPKDQERALTFALKTWQDFGGEFGYDNRLNPEKEGAGFEGTGDPARTICSVRDLSEFIQERIHLDLGAAAFDKNDKALIPKAGNCVDCPKRSGFNKELFSDITKADICTDHVCFAAKQVAHLEQLKAGLKKEKQRFIEITADQRKPEGHASAITERSFKKVKEGSCKFCRVGIYIDGANKGHTVTICNVKKECKKHWPEYQSNRVNSGAYDEPTTKPKSLTEEIKWRIEQLGKNIDFEVNARLTGILVDEIPDRIDAKLEHTDLVQIFSATSWYGKDAAKKKMKLKGNPENWKQKDLARAIKLASFYSGVDEPDDILNYAKHLGIDIPGIVKQLKLEVPKDKKVVEEQKAIEKLKEQEKVQTSAKTPKKGRK